MITNIFQVSISRQQCPVIELTLTLNLINHERNNLTETFNNIPIPISSHSYIIQDLVPGFEYDVKLTPKTLAGDLTPSLTYRVKPKFTSEFFQSFD